MDPEVISDTPGKCPICGMNLEQVPPATSSAPQDDNMSGMSGMGTTAEPSPQRASNMGSSPVPGLVPVTIEPQRLQLIGVRTGTVQTRSLDGSLRLVAYITPDETRLSNVQVRFSGWVKELAVDQTGQFVEANQKLLSVYSQDLYQAEQDYVSAREAMSRDSDEYLKRTHKTLMEAARVRLNLLGVPKEEMALLDLGHAPATEVWLRSPASGSVLEKNVTAGQFISPDQNLFTIADLSRVWVLADVYERDLANVQVGQTARMTVSAYPGESFEGKVSFIYPSVSEQTRTLKIRIEFSNSSHRLKPGMYAEVDLAGQGRGVLAVPADAVMDGGDRQYAFVVHDGIHFEPRLLKLGRSSDDYFEVLSGLSEGEQVVTSANFLIDSESRLKAAIAGMGGTQPDAHAGHGM
jgi:Cu(I)/Ag(I) efflux system membrane fusion protein